ncbi:MAG: BON domain-containing protein [Candidatus Berkiellales bacterium]
MFNSNQTIKIISVISLCGMLYGCGAIVAGTAVSGAVIGQDRRAASTIVYDKSIQFKAKEVVADVSEGNVKVHVSPVAYNNSVLLVGQVPNKKMRSEIEKEVRRISKVRRVHNEITVGAPPSSLIRASDSWITTKIKSEMAVTQDMNPTRVKVITEDSIVYLMGIVKGEEDEIAVDIARHTKGVKKVVKIFEGE